MGSQTSGTLLASSDCPRMEIVTWHLQMLRYPSRCPSRFAVYCIQYSNRLFGAELQKMINQAPNLTELRPALSTAQVFSLDPNPHMLFPGRVLINQTLSQ